MRYGCLATERQRTTASAGRRGPADDARRDLRRALFFTLLPVVTAADQGDFGALVALTSVVGGVGGDLIANQIQDAGTTGPRKNWPWNSSEKAEE